MYILYDKKYSDTIITIIYYEIYIVRTYMPKKCAINSHARKIIIIFLLSLHCAINIIIKLKCFPIIF